MQVVVVPVLPFVRGGGVPPGVGQARAEAIISYREEHGAFVSPEDIMKVSGIKTALFEKMKDNIAVD